MKSVYVFVWILSLWCWWCRAILFSISCVTHPSIFLATINYQKFWTSMLLSYHDYKMSHTCNLRRLLFSARYQIRGMTNVTWYLQYKLIKNFHLTWYLRKEKQKETIYALIFTRKSNHLMLYKSESTEKESCSCWIAKKLKN